MTISQSNFSYRLSTGFLILICSSCHPVTSSETVEVLPLKSPITSARAGILWSSEFSDPDWMTEWAIRDRRSWGFDNINIVADLDHQFSRFLRVRYPAGSASPSVSRNEGTPLGGAQFYADLNISPQTALRLSYFVRFSENFDFVKGGKLPGLFGGTGGSGGRIPNGTDGFSTRLMWRREGKGEVYAYLPTSEKYGTSIGRGTWRFQPGVWHRIEQEVILNRPATSDGQVRIWVDGVQVVDQAGLTFRTVDTLKINGIFFSTFFGGGDSSWATPQDVYTDFANFSITTVDHSLVDHALTD
ncbi:MAG: hypothetical protein F6K19_02355 [Cyanothece sp. SIO1E1]|nr:hypothetical protein [Cyanothece sp. SIO1E1]